MKTENKNFKSLRFKTGIALLVFIVFLSLTIGLVLNNVMVNNTNNLENTNVSDHVVRAINEINSEIDVLSLIAQDYAYWDSTYEYLIDGNEEYVNENLKVANINNLNLDTMVFIDNSGKYIFARRLDESRKEIVPVSQSFIDYINKSNIPKNMDINYQAKGIIQLEEGLMLIVSCPILNSNGEGPVGGNLIVGYYLNDERIDLLSEKLNLDLNLEQIDKLNSEKSQILNSMDLNTPVLVRPFSNDVINGYSTLNDIYDNPIALLNIELDRGIMKIVKEEILMVIIMSLIAILISTVYIQIYLDKNILKRLKNLSKEIRNIGDNKLFYKRIKSQKMQDEITIVSDEINYMLDELERCQIQSIKSEHALKKANEELESKVNERTMALSKNNLSLQAEIKERKKTEEKIEYLAYHDCLTGLANRLLFANYLDNAIGFASRMEKKLAIMFLDIDSFKMINDTMGHLAGDKLLKEVADRILEVVGKMDIVSRIGGDEFLILVENIEDVKDIETIANNVLKCFGEPFVIEDQDCFITSSIGVALYPADGNTSDILIKNADIAMYKAKDKGKNTYAMCTTLMKNNVEEAMILTNKLHRALEKNELVLFYQPQVDCNTRQIVGVEALIRWNHPEMGIVSPGKFIPIAEQTGLIIPIGEWVLRTACQQNKIWQEAGYPKIRIGVNISVKQFEDKNLINQVNEILTETGIGHEYLELEVTESIVMKEKKHIIEILDKFKENGVHIAIDDFGTEYSSLSYLKNIPADRIKIAMPFVQGINVNNKDEAIIKAIIVLAKSMGMSLIAEGVETEKQLSFLAEKDCDEIQGFYFYKPMPAAEIEELFKQSMDNIDTDFSINPDMSHN